MAGGKIMSWSLSHSSSDRPPSPLLGGTHNWAGNPSSAEETSARFHPQFWGSKIESPPELGDLGGDPLAQPALCTYWIVTRRVLFGMAIVLSLAHSTSAQQTKPTAITQSPTGTAKQIAPVPTPQQSVPVTGKIPAIVPLPPPPPLPAALRETPNNPLAPPQNMDDLLKLQMTTDIWAAMYSPLSCLDVTADCITRLQQEATQNSPVIRQLEAKIATVNEKIQEATNNNKKSIDLSIFEPGLQVFLKQDTVVENGQSRRMGFIERVGQIFTNPGGLLNDLLGAIGIPLLRGAFGGNDAQQSRAIQISDLTVKVAEIERIKVEVGAKTRERVQQLILDFDVVAREFQAEQAIATSETKSFKLYAVTYAAGDGDTNIYLNRKGQLDRTKLQMFKNWARVRAQITAIKTVVSPREQG